MRRLVVTALIGVGAVVGAAQGIVRVSAAVPERQAEAPRHCLTAGGEASIPAGATRIGDDRGYPEERPAYDASVDAFRIDVTEVTNDQFARFVAATGHVTTAEKRGSSVVFTPPSPGDAPTGPDQWWRVVPGADWRHPQGPHSVIDGRGDDPVVHVSFVDATAYARWAGRRLPTEEEYERAARIGLASPGQQPAPDSANTWQGSFPQANLATDGHAGVAPVGCYRANGAGVHDLIGNVWEWTASWYVPTHGPVPDTLFAPDNPSFDPRQPGVRTRVIKGGSFLCAANYCARYRPAARHAQAELETASHIGFRTAG